MAKKSTTEVLGDLHAEDDNKIPSTRIIPSGFNTPEKMTLEELK